MTERGLALGDALVATPRADEPLEEVPANGQKRAAVRCRERAI
jgi:hypothetical protein